MEALRDSIKLLNSFDIGFLAVLLWQSYKGYSQGFRVMLYHTVKWVALIVGLFAADRFLLPMLQQQDRYVGFTENVNQWCHDFVLQFTPKDNIVAELLFEKMAAVIPYDRILFFLAAVIIVSAATRWIIIGRLWGDEPEGRGLGVLLGILKTVALCYLLMSVIAAVMTKTHAESYEAWIGGSLILSTLRSFYKKIL